MREIALHVLDLIQNALRADASRIEVEICENTDRDLLTVCIRDNGRGMDAEQLEKAGDPFGTTRKTRGVGMGIPLFKAACEMCAGRMEIESEPGRGTEVRGTLKHSHIDRAPLGDMAGVIAGVVGSYPKQRFVYHHCFDGREFTFDSREIEEVLEDVPKSHPRVIRWMEEYIAEGLKDISSN